MSELTGSLKTDTTYVLREIFGISCEKPSDKIAEDLAEAVMKLSQCSKAIGLVPVPGPLASGKVAQILVNMAKQLRNKNVSPHCVNQLIRAKKSDFMIACMGL